MAKQGKISSKKQLAMILSHFEGFENPKVMEEQYITEPEIAADIIWAALMAGDLDGKVADLGCGTGILGLGAFVVGAKDVLLVDNDKDAVEIAKKNLKYLIDNGFVDEKDASRVEFVVADVAFVDEKTKADSVIQNPPFGTKQKHADRIFLEKALNMAEIVYSFHKTSTTKFVEAFCRDNNADITERFEFSFPLKQTQKFHKKRLQRIDVSCFRIERKSAD